MIKSNFQSRFFLCMSMAACFMGVLRSEDVTWHVVPETESVLIQDHRWHTLTGKAKSVMLQIVGNECQAAAQALKDDAATYQMLSGKYDLLAMSYTDKTLTFFLMSQGVKITDQAIKAFCYNMTQFLEFGLSPNHTLSNGDTILHNAIKNKDWRTVEVLLEAHADVTLTDAAGKTPFEYVTLSDESSYYFVNNKSLLYKHLTWCQKVRSACPRSETVIQAVCLAAMVYGYYKAVIESK